MPPAEDRPSKAVSVERKLEFDWLYPKKLGVLKYGRCQDDPSDKNKNLGSERKIKNRE